MEKVKEKGRGESIENPSACSPYFSIVCWCGFRQTNSKKKKKKSCSVLTGKYIGVVITPAESLADYKRTVVWT